MTASVEAERHSDSLTGHSIPNQLGVDYNMHLLGAFAEHVAPALGWEPNTEGPTTGYAEHEIPV